MGWKVGSFEWVVGREMPLGDKDPSSLNNTSLRDWLLADSFRSKL